MQGQHQEEPRKCQTNGQEPGLEKGRAQRQDQEESQKRQVHGQVFRESGSAKMPNPGFSILSKHFEMTKKRAT